MAAAQQDQGDHRKYREEIEDGLALERDPRDGERDEADDQEHGGQLDAPALVDRVAAIQELAELRLHEGPAGADIGADAGGAIVGLIVGLIVYAPTAPFAVVELGLAGAALDAGAEKIRRVGRDLRAEQIE